MSASWRMKALCLAGRIILENGGETYRAEDTVMHIAQALGLAEVDVFGVPSGMFVSYTDENDNRQTSVSRVYLRGFHLARVDAVNQISRRLTSGELEPSDLYAALKDAERLGADLSPWYMPAAAALSALGFAVMFGGGPIDMLIGAFCAALTQLVNNRLSHRTAGSMASALIGSVFCTMIPLLFHAVTGLGVTDAMVVSALMPLLPGLSMTNAVQDILRGDMVSGVAHGARAVMIAALVAGGALMGTRLFHMMELGMHLAQVTPAAVQSQQLGMAVQVLVVAASSFVAGAGFGALLHAPKKAILWGGLIAIVGYLTYWFMMQESISEIIAMFVAAFAAATFGQLAARKLRMIATVFVTIAILPLVPGLGLYRAMSALGQSDISGGLAIAAKTMALFLIMAIGIGLGSALFSARRRQESRMRL